MEQFNLKLLFWETTRNCNLSCQHCRMEENLLDTELSTDQARHLIDSIAAFSSPILILSGGEPLMRPDIFEIASYASAQRIKTAMATNGTLLNQTHIKEIQSSGIQRVSVSIDGVDARTHDNFRNSEGAFDKAMNGIDLLVSNNISTQINATITRFNNQDIEEIIRLGLYHHIDAIHFFLVVPVGCGKQLSLEERLTPSEYEATLQNIFTLTQKYNNDIFIKVTCAPQYYRILKQKSPGMFTTQGERMQHISKGCLAGTHVCFVSATGDVYPCGYLPVSAGHILKKPLKEIWQESAVFKQLRLPSQLAENCYSCSFVDICGGCRARAYYESGGNLMAADPNCILNTNLLH
jgi:radical SAM protein with 4Fe4S-binding SPASM domain